MDGGFRRRRFTLRHIVLRAALPAVAGALLLAGCGGSSGNASAASSSSASTTSTAKLSAFQSCLKQHGVKITPGQFGGRPGGSFSPGARPTGSFTRRAFPSGSPRPRGSFASADSAAFKACQKYAPAGFGRGGGQAINASTLAAFKGCMSSHGVKLTGTTASAVLAEVRSSTGKTATAFKTCGVLLRPAAAPSPST